MNIDKIRKVYLSIAEAIDAFRLIPRLLVGGYAWLVYKVVMWYMALPDPTTQHAALVTTVVSMAAAIIGLYSSTGRKWNGFTPWKNEKDKTEQAGE